MKIIISEDYKMNAEKTEWIPCIQVQISTKENPLTPDKYEQLYSEIEKIKAIMLSVIP